MAFIWIMKWLVRILSDSQVIGAIGDHGVRNLAKDDHTMLTNDPDRVEYSVSPKLKPIGNAKA